MSENSLPKNAPDWAQPGWEWCREHHLIEAEVAPASEEHTPTDPEVHEFELDDFIDLPHALISNWPPEDDFDHLDESYIDEAQHNEEARRDRNR